MGIFRFHFVSMNEEEEEEDFIVLVIGLVGSRASHTKPYNTYLYFTVNHYGL